MFIFISIMFAQVKQVRQDKRTHKKKGNIFLGLVHLQVQIRTFVYLWLFLCLFIFHNGMSFNMWFNQLLVEKFYHHHWPWRNYKAVASRVSLSQSFFKNRPEYFTKTIVSGYVSVPCWQNDGTKKWFPIGGMNRISCINV